MNLKSKERRLQGSPVSEGIAIGAPYFLAPLEERIPEFPIAVTEVDTEISRYRKALFSSKEDLRRLRHDLAIEGSSEAASFIDTHIQMLDDPMITVQMEERIRHMLRNTESVFRSTIREYETRFSERSDSFFEERLVDVRDVSERILGHLCADQKPALGMAPRGCILFAKELAPSHTAAALPTQIFAFVTEQGGGNSHCALIARAKGIPFVAGIDVAELQPDQAAVVIVDGLEGVVILNPTEETLAHYKERRDQLITRYQVYEKENPLKAETLDEFPIRLMANVGNPVELDLFPYAQEGIGLFRTEYFFLQGQRVFPSEEQQVRVYSSLIEKVGDNKPIIMRVFDLGGDKHPAFFPKLKEPNPALGSRGIRFLLKTPEIFYIQLRALFKAAKQADVRLLLPLISDLGELLQVKKLIEKVKKELRAEGMEVRDLPIGCMIEVPSAVMICEALAQEGDFLSIGTNDLVQYTLGVDRSNPAMSELFYPAHPSVLRMIKMICQVGNRLNKPVTICGEMASNPLFTPLLLGLGLTTFSCAPRYLPLIKQTIRKWTIVEAYKLAEDALRLNDPHAITELLLFKQRNG